MADNSFWTKWIAQESGIRVVALEATHACRSLTQIHKLSDRAAAHFAESIVGALLIASTHKENESVNLIVDHSAFFKKQVIDATPEGSVRGFAVAKEENPEEIFPPMLSLVYTKSHKNNWPYRGVVELKDKHMDEALINFCLQSEQLATAIGIHIEHDQKQVIRAGGILVQIMGGASTEDRKIVDEIAVEELRKNAKELSLTKKFDPHGLDALSDHSFKLMEHSPIIYKCPCTEERMIRGLRMLPNSELVDIFNHQNPVVATCDFCLKQYRLSKDLVLSAKS
jgi:molecular chaperone Hsp33